jgi:hypothetical protein
MRSQLLSNGVNINARYIDCSSLSCSGFVIIRFMVGVHSRIVDKIAGSSSFKHGTKLVPILNYNTSHRGSLFHIIYLWVCSPDSPAYFTSHKMIFKFMYQFRLCR